MKIKIALIIIILSSLAANQGCVTVFSDRNEPSGLAIAAGFAGDVGFAYAATHNSNDDSVTNRNRALAIGAVIFLFDVIVNDTDPILGRAPFRLFGSGGY